MYLIQLRACLSWSMVAVAVTTMITLFEKSVEIKVILVIFPDNATHLIQLLDVSVLEPLNSVLKHCVS